MVDKIISILQHLESAFGLPGLIPFNKWKGSEMKKKSEKAKYQQQQVRNPEIFFIRKINLQIGNHPEFKTVFLLGRKYIPNQHRFPKVIIEKVVPGSAIRN